MSRKAEPGHELSEMPSQSSQMSLLINENSQRPNGSQEQSQSKLRDCLRQFRLQFVGLVLGRLLSWKSPTEPRKVALYRSRWVAALYSLLHLIPLSGAVTLLVLRATSYWVGYTSDDSTVLQFVAKFHELLMQASLVEVLLCIVRTQAVYGFVPLGALSGAVQATQLSYLWSLDFASLIRSSALRGWRKATFVFLFPLLLGLIALVGPSSAVLMIPRPGSPHLDGIKTRYVSNSTEVLYPTHLDKSFNLSWDFPSFNSTIATGWNDGSDYFRRFEADKPTPRSYLTRGEETINPRLMRYTRLTSSDASTVLNNILYPWYSYDVNATIPTVFSADSFWRLSSGGMSMRKLRNATVQVEVAQPVVTSKCRKSYEPKTSGANISYWLDNKTSLDVLSDIGTLVALASGPSEFSYTNYSNSRTVNQYFPVVWLASPEPGSKSIVGVFFVYSWEEYLNATRTPMSLSSLLLQDPLDVQQNLETTVCTISAYWNTVDLQQIHSDGAEIVQTEPMSMTPPRNARPITFNMTGIDTLQGAQFVRLLYGFNSPWEYLATIFATVISDIPRWTSKEVQVLDRLVQPNSDPNNITTLVYTTTLYGYGYGTTSTSIRLSIAVILTYCIVTISFIIYTLTTGSVSSAWNSAIELVSLALQSKKPDHLGHTAVGIDSINTFSESVGIRVNNDNELELVFAHDRAFGAAELRKIERNRAY